MSSQRAPDWTTMSPSSGCTARIESIRERSSEMPAKGATKWPSREVPPLNGIKGIRYLFAIWVKWNDSSSSTLSRRPLEQRSQGDAHLDNLDHVFRAARENDNARREHVLIMSILVESMSPEFILILIDHEIAHSLTRSFAGGCLAEVAFHFDDGL